MAELCAFPEVSRKDRIALNQGWLTLTAELACSSLRLQDGRGGPLC